MIEAEGSATVTADAFDVDAVEQWVVRHVPHLTPPFEWTPLTGGHSNLTYRLSDARGASAVIRRPPLGNLLPKAHDMRREWTILAALEATSVPAPEPLAFCADRSVAGVDFYVMGWVAGRTLPTSQDIEAHVRPTDRPKLAFSFIDHLADLHSIDPQAVGLQNFGPADDYIARQLRSWGRAWSMSAAVTGIDDRRASSLGRFLGERRPVPGPARIVHGDYGLHNCLVGADSTVAAIIDWEISTLGDPLADLAYSLVRWPGEDDALDLPSSAPARVDHFPGRAELVERYARRTGASVDGLDYYMAFNFWKAAAIVNGVYARYLQSSKPPPAFDLREFGSFIDQALSQAQAAADALGR